MSFESKDVERKTLAILKILQNLQKPAGARIIAQHLEGYGVSLSERAVRYHLKMMDERGLTALVGTQDGRIITDKGIAEVKNALVKDKVGLCITKIELLAYRTDFDIENRRGNIPVNVSIFPENNFNKALRAMRPAFDKGFCVSRLVAVAGAGQNIGDVSIPEGKVGFATVCSIVVNGTLLKAGIPMDSRLSGILQMENRKPVRYTDIIHYNGSSLDPSEIFIRAKMTSVMEAVNTGNGEVLANFREIPAICLPLMERVTEGLKTSGMDGILARGNPSEPVCEISVDQNKIGLILIGGLNPVAAAQESGIEAENHCMSTIVDYQSLTDFSDLLK
jgi:HTH-type transcriptional regulator, global nitrogen regulator NrpRI